MALVDTVADGELELMYIYFHVSSTKPVALSLTILMIDQGTCKEIPFCSNHNKMPQEKFKQKININ